MVRFDGLRNAGGGCGDNDDEMLRRGRCDERTADAVLTGRGGRFEGDDLADLAAFVAAVRSEATMTRARPSAVLAEVLAHGISDDKVDRPAMAASNADGPETRVSAPPNRRTRTLLEPVAASFAALSLAAKAGIAGAAVVATTTGAGAAGVLPDTLQSSFDDVVRGTEEPEVDTEDAGVDDADIAEDATDPHDPGVEGREVADEASDDPSTDGLGQVDEASDDAGNGGLDRADDAQEHAPEPPDEIDEGPERAEDGEADADGLPDEADNAPAGSRAADDRPEVPVGQPHDQPGGDDFSTQGDATETPVEAPTSGGSDTAPRADVGR